jgi:hypothetical protein
MNAALPCILFGAFDRHNLGDLLFPHLLAAQLPGARFEHAGLATRDLRRFGGHRVAPLGTQRRGHLIHVGGELLGCSAYEAAVMLLDPAAAAQAITRYDGAPDAAAWAARQLGTARALPYVAGREAVAAPGRLIFNAVGGVDWALLPPAARAEARAALAAADWVSVRDRATLAALRAEGIDAALSPDPAVMVRACCGERIARHAARGEVHAMRQAFPQGYLACQFSAEFGDDASLDALAQGLADVAAASGLGLVLFQAGVAPWHDDAVCQDALLRRLPRGMARRFVSLHVWDLCALIAASRGTLASSLHARIVALAYGLPRVSLRPPRQNARPDKRDAFVATWETDAMPGSVAAGEIGRAALAALDVSATTLAEHAEALEAAHCASLAQWAGLLSTP